MFHGGCWRHKACKVLFLGLSLLTCFQILHHIYDVSVIDTETVATKTPQKVLPFEQFRYPLDVNMTKLVAEYKEKDGRISEKPINTYPYMFLTEVPDKCKSSETVNLILVVKSATMNFRRRFAIRETWGNESTLKHIHVKVVFILGKPQDAATQTLINHEIAQNGDVVQIDYVDSYYNNTLKTTGALIWATQHCSNAKFMMIADDDFYVATDFLVKELTSFPESMYDKLFMGYVWNDIPQRGKNQKWYMPVDVYPYNRYPPFVSAGATIMSMRVATDINIAIKFTRKFKFDDVFLAIVIYKLGIKPIHSDRIFIMKKVEIKSKEFISALASHNYDNTDELRAAWSFHKQNAPKLKGVR